jgi:enoyl-CoA hydratase/carnithine racemase
LAEKISKNGPLACMAIKELAWRGGLCMPLDNGLRLEKLFARINRDSADAREGAASFVRKAKPIYRGK